MQCRLLNIEFSAEFIIAIFRVNAVIRNVGKYLPADKEWHPKRLKSSTGPLWEPQISQTACDVLIGVEKKSWVNFLGRFLLDSNGSGQGEVMEITRLVMSQMATDFLKQASPSKNTAPYMSLCNYVLIYVIRTNKMHTFFINDLIQLYFLLGAWGSVVVRALRY